MTLTIPDIVVVDVETTGGCPPSHRVIEVAAVRLRYQEERRRISTLLNPRRDFSNAIVALTGITPEMTATAPLFEDVAETLYDFMDGAIFCAHNASFDQKFLKNEFAMWGAVPPSLEDGAPVLCTVRLSRRLFPYLPNHKLDTIAEYLDLQFSARHRALGDALVTAEIFRVFLGMIYRRGLEDLDDILDFQRKRAHKKTAFAKCAANADG